jgi:hypothetical protein
MDAAVGQLLLEEIDGCAKQAGQLSLAGLIGALLMAL